jgi:hypothetical protein
MLPIGKWRDWFELWECDVVVAAIRSFLRRRSSRSFCAKSDLLAILILAVSQTKWKNVVYGNVVAGGMGSNKMEKWLRGYHQSWLRGEVCHLSSSNTLASQYWTLTKIHVQVIPLSLSLSLSLITYFYSIPSNTWGGVRSIST